MLSVTVTGLSLVGLTEDDGEKLQLAPAGNPLHPRLTPPANVPVVLTMKVIAGPTAKVGNVVTAFGEGGVIAISLDGGSVCQTPRP